ncbi:C2 and GRAM domain-containing protein [Platanthera guangdongensis]|uniref:C2 and GRAM domain-containing protein n=1 Tax=Platanthera guangdongensis TaxID=2320717 RepID=A0ABR2MFL0_9ASPA
MAIASCREASRESGAQERGNGPSRDCNRQLGRLVELLSGRESLIRRVGDLLEVRRIAQGLASTGRSSGAGSDHGIKAQGDGWLLTVALIEGNDLAAVDSSGYCDPYVVFTCNGRAKTSSIKFQTLDPHWNGNSVTFQYALLMPLLMYLIISSSLLCWSSVYIDAALAVCYHRRGKHSFDHADANSIGAGPPIIPLLQQAACGLRTAEAGCAGSRDAGPAEIFEFDAMIDPPSTMDIDVYDFDGPFDEAVSLGHTEVNFLKSNLSELADVWIYLKGKLAQACQSKLHLRIFLNNTRGVQVVSDYLTKMEKEVGKKINLRSPQTNSAFQKLFGLPPEEFLINDFTCHLKRKMPIQGRLFLSTRITGFYTNLFGHKIKFFFLWEDIEDIQIIPPSLTSMGSPSLLIILRRGRGLDARHGAKALDPDGRLKFHFQSFVSFNVANR